MRIVIGSMQCEGNTLTPIRTTWNDFDLAEGDDMLQKVNVVDLLEEAGAEIVPTLYAHALPGGPVVKEDYLRLVHGLVERIPETGIDGVWLYLHGAMQVEVIGSGEEYLLREIRRKIGDSVPISLAMDFHADNSDAVIEMSNIICGFRTAPHIDRVETERKAMRLLLRCVQEGLLPHPVVSRCPVVIPGDAVQTAVEPLRSIMAEANRMEVDEEVLCAQVFNGQPWVDQPYMGPNMVVTCVTDTEKARQLADRLAKLYYEARYDFKFEIEALPPAEALKVAFQAPERPVFVSDSGDNPTAGAAGDNAFMLRLLLERGAADVLLAGITDPEACRACYAASIGDVLELDIGGAFAADSERVHVSARLAGTGLIHGYNNVPPSRAAVLEAGGITLILAERRAVMTTPGAFADVGIDPCKFKVVVIKLGYLFPDIAPLSARSILAFTPGSSTERLEDMHLKHITRPIYPLDDHFM